MSNRSGSHPSGAPPNPRASAGTGGHRHGSPFGSGPMGFALPGEKAKNFRGTLQRLLGYLSPYRIELIAVLAMSVLSTVFSVVGPKIVGKAITKLFEGITGSSSPNSGSPVDFTYIGNLMLLLLALYFVSAVFSYVTQFLMVGITQKTVYRLRQEVDAKLALLPLKFFDTKTHGEILSRVTNDVDTLSSTLQQSLVQMLTAIVTLIGSIVMMFTISRQLTLLAMATLPLYGLATALIARQSHKHFREQQKCLGEINGYVEEMYTGHKIVKAFGHEHKSTEIFEVINDRLYGAAWKAQFITGIIMPLMNFINNLGFVLICVVGSILVIRRALDLGDIQAFIQYARQFTHPILQTANISNILQSTMAASERVFELLDEQEEIPDRPEALSIDTPKGAVTFEQVKFGYADDSILMEDLTIRVEPGETIAVVGPTGAGKTTLVNLLMRFYEIMDGTITVDQVDIRQLSRAGLRRLFGMVLQDTWLFHGTIRDNIAYGREKATEEEIQRAAMAAHADHFIRTLPEGYRTVLNEEASNISQGQRQLLTIARAFLADPAILILDEATSSVDTRTEVLIQEAMARLMKGRTSFVIAHRLSTIRNAHTILVMHQGQIIEKGTHPELLAAKGFYADLYNSQFLGADLRDEVC